MVRRAIDAVRRCCSAAIAGRAIPRCARSSSGTTSRWRAVDRPPLRVAPRAGRGPGAGRRDRAHEGDRPLRARARDRVQLLCRPDDRRRVAAPPARPLLERPAAARPARAGAENPRRGGRPDAPARPAAGDRRDRRRHGHHGRGGDRGAAGWNGPRRRVAGRAVAALGRRRRHRRRLARRDDAGFDRVDDGITVDLLSDVLDLARAPGPLAALPQGADAARDRRLRRLAAARARASSCGRRRPR